MSEKSNTYVGIGIAAAAVAVAGYLVYSSTTKKETKEKNTKTGPAGAKTPKPLPSSNKTPV